MAKFNLSLNMSKVLMVSALYVTFVTIYYFTMGTALEAQVVGNNIDTVAESIKSDIMFLDSTMNLVVNSDKGKTLKLKSPPNPFTKLKGVKVDKTKDAAVQQKNDATRKKAYKVSAIFASVLVVLSISIGYMGGLKSNQLFSKVVGPSALVVLFIAIAELVFFNLVTANYRSIDMTSVYDSALTRVCKLSKTD